MPIDSKHWACILTKFMYMLTCNLTCLLSLSLSLSFTHTHTHFIIWQISCRTRLQQDSSGEADLLEQGWTSALASVNTLEQWKTSSQLTDLERTPPDVLKCHDLGCFPRGNGTGSLVALQILVMVVSLHPAPLMKITGTDVVQKSFSFSVITER